MTTISAASTTKAQAPKPPPPPKLSKPPVIQAPSPNQSSRGGTDIDTIVLHHTASNSGANDLAWLRNPKSEVSAHYMVDRDGKIYQLVGDSKRAWHAGNGALHGVPTDVNDRSIGIEIVNKGDGKTAYTEAQYKALEKLVPWIAQTYKVPQKNLVGHKDVAIPKGRKSDPSSNFDFGRIRKAVTKATTGTVTPPKPGPKPEPKPGPTPGVPTVDLKRGSKGADVRALQASLVKLRHMSQADVNTGPGVFGPRTESALKSFQRSAGVTVDGKYGPVTRAALKKKLAAAKPSPAPAPPPSAAATPTKPSTYTVRSGDSFSLIAQKHKMTVAGLQKLNPKISNINLIFPGQKINVAAAGPKPEPKPGPQPAPKPEPKPDPKPGVLPKGIPNTEGMSDAQEYALYSKYVAKHGDAKSKADLAAGKRVIVGLRRDTPFTSDRAYRGTYDDRLVVMWKDSKGMHVEEFSANTEPSRRWADDPSQSTKPVGRLVANKSYHYKKSFKSAFGGNILAPDLSHGVPTVQRDTNRNHKIDSADKVYSGDWGGQGYYFHRGGTSDTYSAGCQTMDQGRFNSFWSALGSQSEFSYVLASVA